MTSTTDNPVPPENCTCASFWTVRHAHKKDCPLVDTDIEELRREIFKRSEVTYKLHTFDIIPEEVVKIGLDELMQLITKETKQAREIFIPVKGYEGLYEVSNTGKVRSTSGGRRSGKELSQSDLSGKAPYQVVSLCKDGVSKSQRVHRLVAEAFISNPELKRTVNHKDGNHRNNDVSNLEWATYSEQEVHSYEVLGKINSNHPLRHPDRKPPTHCPQGHEYTKENKYIKPNGKHYGCRKCNAQKQAEFRLKKQLKLNKD